MGMRMDMDMANANEHVHEQQCHPVFVTQLQPIDEPLYQCSACLECDLTRSFQFCPHCGRKIVWVGDAEMLVAPERMRFQTRLTQRQKEVFLLRVQGLTLKDIARKLDLSPDTIDVHANNINKVLNLHSLSDLILFAHRAGLVDRRLKPTEANNNGNK
jgi:DNA-binding CsgD family transcriptional regulator